MKTTPYQPLKTVVAAGLLAGALVASCSADIIYQDTFARAGAGPLAGSSPTIDNTGGAATWSGDASYTSDGTIAVVNENYYGGLLLPLDWVNTYPNPRVQVDVKIGNTGDWFQLVLGDPTQYWGSGQTAVMQLTGNGDLAIYTGPGWGFTTLTNITGAGIAQDWNRLRIEYSNTLGTATFYLNGNVILQDVPITTQYTGVGFDTFGGNTHPYNMTNFLVTFGNDATFPPDIPTQPEGQTVFVGDAVKLSAQTTGTLPLHYTWCKDGNPIPGPNGNAFSIPSAAMSDTGDYTVVVTNNYGAKTSEVARVEVHLEAQSPLCQINFDDLTNNLYAIGYTFSDGANLPCVWGNAPGTGVGGSTGFRVDADGSDFQNVSVTYSGFSAAVGLALPPLKVANLDFYEAYASVRIENLLDTMTNAPGRLALRFYIPDPNNAGQSLDIADVTKSLTLTSNFQAVAFVLNTADYGGANGLTNFVANVTNVTRVQFEFTADNFYTDFVQGPDCVMVVDDLKLASRHSPPLTASLNAGQVVLQWDDPNVKLQGAAEVSGPYTDISPAAAPYPVPADSPYHFFRTSFTVLP